MNKDLNTEIDPIDFVKAAEKQYKNLEAIENLVNEAFNKFLDLLELKVDKTIEFEMCKDPILKDRLMDDVFVLDGLIEKARLRSVRRSKLLGIAINLSEKDGE